VGWTAILPPVSAVVHPRNDLEETKRKTVESLLAAEQEKLSQIKSERAAAKTLSKRK
jgi:hypothetical protein